MTTPFTPIDIVNFAANKDAVGIQTAFDQLVSTKIQDAIQQRKVEIAKSLLGEPEASQEQEDGEQQTDGVMSGETEEQESEESHENAEQHA